MKKENNNGRHDFRLISILDEDKFVSIYQNKVRHNMRSQKMKLFIL